MVSCFVQDFLGNGMEWVVKSFSSFPLDSLSAYFKGDKRVKTRNIILLGLCEKYHNRYWKYYWIFSSPAWPEPAQARGPADDPGEGRAPGSGLQLASCLGSSSATLGNHSGQMSLSDSTGCDRKTSLYPHLWWVEPLPCLPLLSCSWEHRARGIRPKTFLVFVSVADRAVSLLVVKPAKVWAVLLCCLILVQISVLCVPGKLWSRSLKLAYTLLNKLGTKNEPVLKPGDRVMIFRSFCFSLWSKTRDLGAGIYHRHHSETHPRDKAAWDRNWWDFSGVLAPLWAASQLWALKYICSSEGNAGFVLCVLAVCEPFTCLGTAWGAQACSIHSVGGRVGNNTKFCEFLSHSRCGFWNFELVACR